MYTDLILAIPHHLLIFALAGIIAAELVLVRPGLKTETLGMLARIDGAYGMIAMLIIVVGICRVFFGLKGWEYYIYNWAFWAKMAAFAGVGLLSIRPTMRFIAWRKAPQAIRHSPSPRPRSAAVRATSCRGDGVLPADPDLRRHHGARHRLLIEVRRQARAAPTRPAAPESRWS